MVRLGKLSRAILIGSGVLCAIAAGSLGNVIKAEAPKVRGDQLRTFDSKWTQLIFQADEWNEHGSVSEVLESVEENGRSLWLRTQVAQPGPVGFINRTYFDKTTLLPVRFEREISPDVPAELLPRIAQAGFLTRYRVDFDGTTYRTVVAEGDAKEQTTERGSFDQVPYEGSVLGLVIAALPLGPDYSTRLPIAFIAPQDGTVTKYVVEATVNGREPLAVGGGKTEDAWRVDVAWLDPDTLEVTSEGGPDEAGGAYYVLTKPGKGVPHVLKYRNESVDFELTER